MPKIARWLILLVIGSLGSLLLCAAETDQQDSKADYWAFKFPEQSPPTPEVKDQAWVRNPIDRFVLAKLEEKGMSPASEADRLTLIRRLSFNLHGMPPTPEQVERFLKDDSSGAYARLVGRLLASPRYGERWARHWLDVVHYGETHGYDKDKPRPNAWPYRDYVIRSFNEDKPYSRFIEEQVAGDVLFPDDPQGIVATGFIAAGPWDFVGHVELPESKKDGLKARYNDRDDMVEATMSTFQSLTVHCARCHDHKFDPIPQEDYYQLQAVFAGIDRAPRPYDRDPTVFNKRKELRSRKKALQSELEPIERAIQSISTPEIEGIDERLARLERRLKALPQGDEEKSPSNGYHSEIEASNDVAKWVQVDLGKQWPLDEIRLVPARPTDFKDTPGFGFPVRFRVEASNGPDFEEAVTLLDKTENDFPNPGDEAVAVSGGKRKARYIRVTATRLWERSNDYAFALAELQAFSDGDNVAGGGRVTAHDSIESGRWSRSHLVDNFSSRRPLLSGSALANLEAKEKRWQAEMSALQAKRQRLLESEVAAKKLNRRNRLRGELKKIEDELEGLPEQSTVYAAASDFDPQGNFVPPDGPRPIHLLRRGSVEQKVREVSPGTIDCLPDLKGEFDLEHLQKEGTRRAALAKWLTNPNNLLTRRSIVNRVWHYHFGRGLVDTPNDFGHMGSKPTHPELLDWLAFWFMENGESLKALHKLILTSATYRQGSEHNPDYAARDSGNRFLWRMNRERLDAESFRDSLIFISGRMDTKMGGPPVKHFVFEDDHSPRYYYTQYDVSDRKAFRRSIYRFIVRSVPDPFMTCLDAPDPSILTAKRRSTLTAVQALATLNDSLVVHLCREFAERLQEERSSLPEQVDRMFELALNRHPGPGEREKMIEHARSHGLANACRIVVNSNEFMFVD